MLQLYLAILQTKMEKTKPIKENKKNDVVRELLIGVKKQREHRTQIIIITGVCLSFLVMIVIFLSSLNSVPEDKAVINPQSNTNIASNVSIGDGVEVKSPDLLSPPYIWIIIVVAFVFFKREILRFLNRLF